MGDRKIILITGASAGIGLVTALKLLGEGHTVFGGARRVDAMKPIVDAGGTAFALDVTDDASMRAAVDTVIAKEGRIDVLVNNAGYGLYGAVEDIPMEAARAQMEVNIFGLARMTQLALPHMRSQKSGTIINLSSVGGTIYLPMGAWYHGAKHMVEGFSDALRIEVAPHGIDVAIICPGGIRTEFNDVMTKNILKYSGEGPYSAMAKVLARGASSDRGSDPQVIAKDISHAVNARRPKTRYRSGQMSVSLQKLRRLLPDRWFDGIVKSALKL
ncbi:MAG: oxidoreductase [Sphingorhabdus sp.]